MADFGFRPTGERYSGLVPLAEKALISRIRRQTTESHSRWLRFGIGDDCAVLQVPRGHEALVTTDFSLEGIHFRREWHSPEVVGHRCLVRGLSDIAAMGGEPLAAFLSLALPRNLPQRWVDRFLSGLLALAKRFRITLAGGDTAESPAGVMADIVVLGSAPRGKALARSGARRGDRIFVTGALGGSVAALNKLRRGKQKLKESDYERHFYPLPRIAIGRFLREHAVASAMIDLSDGLSTDLAHICEESVVGAEIEAARVPLAVVGRVPRAVKLDSALHGGEDYELLFTARPGKKVPSHIAGIMVTEIGRVLPGRDMFLISRRGRTKLRPAGWEHFQKP